MLRQWGVPEGFGLHLMYVHALIVRSNNYAFTASIAADEIWSCGHSHSFSCWYLPFVSCSLIAGVCATTAAAPADIIKTRIMADRTMYNGPIDCLIKTIRTEGPQALLKGWVPSYLRLGPHFVIVRVSVE